MSQLLSVIFLFLPFLAIFWVANLAERRRAQGEPHQGFALAAYLLMGLLYLAGLALGLVMQLGVAMMQMQPDLFEAGGDLFAAGVASLPLLALGFWLPSLLGLILLLPPVRRAVARLLPLDADNPVHGVSLAFSMLILTSLMTTLGMGLGNLADLMAESGETGGDLTLLSLWGQQILTALLAMVGVGWLTRRDWNETLQRLGIVVPTPRQWAIGIGLGLGMVPVVLALGYGASLVGLGTDPDVERLTEQLLGPLYQTPFGILTLGLAAALGEETLFRGAVQPRFGLVVTTLMFALIHSNYGITISTLAVFIVGLVLGWLRLRHNTTTAMAMHATYNITLGLLAYLSSSMLDF